MFNHKSYAGHHYRHLDAICKHSIKRAFERYDGLIFTEKDYKWLCKAVRKEDLKLVSDSKTIKYIKRLSKIASIWDLIFGPVILRVVYDNQKQRIITFLPVDSENDNED